MSKLEVKIHKIEILPHPNADKLNIAYVGGDISGYTAIVGKDEFNSGDLAIFIPADSVVPQNIRDWLKANKKIDVRDGRIRCSRIRGQFSDGLCLIPSNWLTADKIFEGNDVKDTLGIIKYEPPEPTYQGQSIKSKGINYRYQNDNFKKYTDIESFKKYPKTFNGEEVVATIKFHGSNWRASIVKRPNKSFTLVEKLKMTFGFKVDKFEYLIGSHNTIRKKGKRATEVKDIFTETANKYKVKQLLDYLRLKHGELDTEVAIYGEVIGPGIQKGYTYGIQDGQHELKIFDIMLNEQYLDWDDVVKYCNMFDLPTADVVYRGPWSMDVIKLSESVDIYNGQKHTREGIVIRTSKEKRDKYGSRAILKYVSETFKLDKNNSDNH